MYFYNNYLSVAEQRKRSVKEVRKLKAIGFKPKPVEAFNGPIAQTPLGKLWCDNIDAYVGTNARLARGRRYARAGSVCHMAVETGKISAMVSGGAMYYVNIELPPIEPERWLAFLRMAANGAVLGSNLAQGNLHPALAVAASLFDIDLIPPIDDMDFSCTCPDGYNICKHTAAVLFAFAHRLDTDPDLLFRFRGVTAEDIFTAQLERVKTQYIDAVISEQDSLANIFGIELDMGNAAAKPAAKSPQAKAKQMLPPTLPVKPPFDPRYPTAKNIRALRKLAGMTREELAQAMNVKVENIRRWETPGPVEFQAATLKKLSRLQDEAMARLAEAT